MSDWFDEWGACKVCGGEIPYGHLNDCHILKQYNRIKYLEDRLEIHPVNLATGKEDKSIILGEDSDGIACRDASIKMQDKLIEKMEIEIRRQHSEIKHLEAEVERLKDDIYLKDN